MKNFKTGGFVALLFLLLLSVIFWALWPKSKPSNQAPRNSKASIENSSLNDPIGSALAKEEPEEGLPLKRKRLAIIRKDPYKDSLRRLEENGPDIINSTVHTVIAEGHSVVTGGYLLADGTREFVILTPTWIDGGKHINLTTKSLKMNREQVEKAGLGSLTTNETKSVQNAEDWSTEDYFKILQQREAAAELVTFPKIVMNPNDKCSLESPATGSGALTLDVKIDTAPEGGFDVKFQVRRLE